MTDMYSGFSSGRSGRPRKGEKRDAALTRRRARLRARLKRYGLTPQDYMKRLKAQGGVCAICGNPPKTQRLSVDHDHKSKRVRGLLCFRCNRYLVGFHTAETAYAVYCYLIA